NPFAFEIMLISPSNEKIALAYARSLERLGVDVRVRVVESAQYQAVLDEFDFDMVVRRWGVSLSPGNEQQNYWSTKTANSPGSRNHAGVSDPAIDAMIDALVAAQDRETLVAAARALDRILMWNYYVVPLYHQPGFRVAYWNRVARPAAVPVYGAVMETFWAQ
ncbi:MAG: ABC transporter substrate-binding protein, partial [Alphaproteobacteria bacterium]